MWPDRTWTRRVAPLLEVYDVSVRSMKDGPRKLGPASVSIRDHDGVSRDIHCGRLIVPAYHQIEQVLALR